MAELVNEFAWSVSRSRTFHECRRQFYYNVYGIWNGWKDDAPERTRQIYVLSKLRTRWMWAGEVVHDAIRDFLLALRRKNPIDFAAWRNQTLDKMRRDWSSSKSKTYREPGKAKTCALFEHEFDLNIPEEKWQDVAGIVEDCLAGFEGSHAYRNISKTDPRDWISLEELIKFKVDDVQVLGKMDIAYRTRERRFRIIDWKTGKDIGEDIEFQMGAYSLAATHLWKASPESIETFAINLRTREENSFPVTPEVLDKTRAKILEDAREMRALLSDASANRALEDDYPGTTDADTCRWCNYQRICPVRQP